MTKTYTFSYYDEDDNEYVVTYTYYPGTEAVMYKRNGDPGEPGDEAELEIIKIVHDNLDVTDKIEGTALWDKIYTAAWDEDREYD